MPASRCAPSWTKRNIPKASRSPISRWLTSTSPATRSMATGTIRFHLIEKITVQNELTELFMDEPLVTYGLINPWDNCCQQGIEGMSSAQRPEERAHVADKELRLLEGGKVAAFRHFAPVGDVGEIRLHPG